LIVRWMSGKTITLWLSMRASKAAAVRLNAYDVGDLHNDVDRFIFLLGGDDAEVFFRSQE